MPCTAKNPAAAAVADNAPRPRKDAVLSQICAQAPAGQGCRQIAATFGLTKSTVSRWLQELREDCPTRVAGSAEVIAHAVARYDALYRKALDAWPGFPRVFPRGKPVRWWTWILSSAV